MHLYCKSIFDEWYSYYQTVLEYQRDAQQKQVDSVKDGIAENAAEYKSAYKDLESERNSYKNRLMSVGSLFSVDTETDENGNTTKIVSVENMRKQMAELAEKLSGKLFEPEMNELNEGLVNGVLEQFGTLPTEIQEIGAESPAAFIAGLTGGDLSEQVDEFAEKFAADCTEGIRNSFANSELDYAALMIADAYSIRLFHRQKRGRRICGGL